MSDGKKQSKAGALTKPLRVAIQGYEGSFHQEAARKFFGKNVEVIPCDNFRQVIKVACDKNESNGGVMAIENSIAGSILPNYNLLQKSDLTIVGEKYLHIRQHLLVNPGVELSDIKEVHSHPMALLQCIDYLEQHHSWKLVETDDTALSARYIHRHKSKHTAAIASKLAAELYELDIIAPDIHTLKNNYTRFLMVQRKGEAMVVDGADKASVYFETDHSKGSLAKVLTAIAVNGVNMNKLQSMPIPGSDFLYGFYADMEIEGTEQFNQVVDDIKPLTAKLKVFGTYKRGNLK
ncbi:prephenate dehydratase [Segetibacter aerophilus]|uniref:prephenate dehydratase n=1 Tax=Segetibacter aerophilus TaxID=670293 RepID=A0A512BFX3_9BACT|nr:prephenate dehydratase [Segetibacter aerophilus]GEO10853.1 prephenate dehydratase [Segetibacter aerophilus]